MSTTAFITELFCRVDDVVMGVAKHRISYLALMLAAFNICTQRNELQPDENGFTRLSIAECSP